MVASISSRAWGTVSPRSEQLELRVVVGAELVEVDLDALDVAALGVDAGLRLDARRDEHAARRRETGVAVESLLVPDQLVHARDLPDALDLDRDGATVAVAAEEVDRADVGRVLAPHEGEVVAQRRHTHRDEGLELGLHPVLLEARVLTELDDVLVEHLVQLDHQPLALGGL